MTALGTPMIMMLGAHAPLALPLVFVVLCLIFSIYNVSLQKMIIICVLIDSFLSTDFTSFITSSPQENVRES